MPNEIGITVAADGSQNLDKVEKDARRAGEGIEKSLRSGFESAEKASRQTQQSIGDDAKKIDRAFAGAADGIRATFDQIEREAWESGQGMDRAMSEAVRSMRADLERVERQAAATGAELDSEIGAALRKIRDDANRTKQELQDALNPPEGWGAGLAESLSDGLDPGGLVDGIVGKLGAGGGALVGAGTAIGAFLWDGVQKQWEANKVGGLIAAQTGAGVSAAGRLGEMAGDTFYDNFGESIEEVGAAMTAVFQNKIIDTRASEQAIDRVTKRVMTLTQTTEESANDVSRATRTLFVTDMAGSITEGMNLIQRGVERGLNTSGELLDTITEYSTQFRSLGLDGQQSFGLLDQAMEGGARNIDVAADALKEFQILAQETGGTAARGFESLGMDAAESAEKIARGGASARDVLAQVLDRLRAMPDSVARNSIAVDLFGTKAEDLGNALYSMDLDTAVQQFGDLEGAVDGAQKTIESSTSNFEAMGRGIKEWSGNVIAAIDDVKGTLQSEGNPLSWDNLFGSGEDAANGAAEGAENAASGMRDVADATGDAAGATEDYVGTIDSLIAKQREVQTGVIDFIDAQIGAQKAITDAEEAISEFAGSGLNKAKTAFDLSTEAGQEMASALNDVADKGYDVVESMRQQNKSNEEIQSYMEGTKRKLYDMAVQSGLSEGAARALADTLMGFPKRVVPVIGIQDRASGPLGFIYRRLQNIPREVRSDVYLYTHYRTSYANIRDMSPTYQGGGGQAHGGITPQRPMTAQTGGARNGATLINEAGPELVELPSGSKVMTAGATRAMAERGLLGGWGGGAVPTKVVELRSDGSAWSDLILHTIREAVRDEGGNVQMVLGRR